MRFQMGKWPTIWAAVCMLLVAAVIALSVALVADSRATTTFTRQQEVTACINHSLAVRQHFIEADHKAEVAKVTGQVKGLLDLEHGKRAGFFEFIRASENYLQVIKRIDKAQLNHPLGKC